MQRVVGCFAMMILLAACNPSVPEQEGDKAAPNLLGVPPTATETLASAEPVQELLASGERWKVLRHELSDGIGAWSTDEADAWLGQRVFLSERSLSVGLWSTELTQKPASGLEIPTACGEPVAESLMGLDAKSSTAPFPPYYARVNAGAVLFGDGVIFCLGAFDENNASIARNVSLSGRLEERTYQGPPGYGETPDEDLDETVWVLQLAQPIRIPEFSDPLDTLMLIPADGAAFGAHKGKLVQVKGAVEEAQTGHHYTPLVVFEAALVD